MKGSFGEKLKNLFKNTKKIYENEFEKPVKFKNAAQAE